MTDKERVGKFKSGKIVVNCSTEEDAKEFVKWCYRNDIKWEFQDESITYFDSDKDEIYYIYYSAKESLCFCDKSYCIDHNYEVITFKEFMKADKNRVTNLEKYYDELISCYKSPNCYWLEVIKKGNCHEMSCKKCGMDFVHWLNEEYKENKEPVKLTKVQYEILKCLPQDSSIIISNNELIIHKDNLEMFMNKLGVKIIDSDNHEEKSFKIKDILEKL